MNYTDVSQMPGFKVDAKGQNIIETLRSKISASQATQSLRFSDTNGDLDVILVDGTIYLRGGANTLVFALGFPATTGPSWSGKWISISQNDSQFAEIAPTLTYESNLDPFLPTGTITVKTNQQVHGQDATILSGNSAPTGTIVKGTTTLFIDPTTKLPLGATVQAVDSKKHTILEVVTFTSFGDPVQAVAPTGATPIATAIGTSAP